MNTIIAALLAVTLGWWWAIIIAGALSELRRKRHTITRNRPVLPRSPAEAWQPRPLPRGGR